MRSRRPIVTTALAGIAWGVVFGGLATFALALPGGGLAAMAIYAGAAVGCLLSAISVYGRLRWPEGRLGLFRDRLLVIEGNREMRALWEPMVSVTLADIGAWPRIQLTDCLTITFRNEEPIHFRPAHFGLQPGACRDLILQLRDDPASRLRLPEFDSARDLVAGRIESRH